MDLKDRAALVREIRFELKQRGSRATPLVRTPRYGRETADQFIRDTADGTDSGPAIAAERWDLGRTKLRGRQRRGVRSAPRWRNEGYYVDYQGPGRR